MSKALLLCSIFTITASIFILNCEEFIGSQFDSNLNVREITVTGSVINTFNGMPVYEANISLGGEKTLTDEKGNFLLTYPLGTDDERNKPVTFLASADKYFPYSKEFIVYPADVNIKVELTYAAPIVINSVYVPVHFDKEEMDLIVCQALISDYQGADDIEEVVTIYYYENANTQEVRRSVIPMKFINQVSANNAHYESLAIPLYQNTWVIRKTFDIQVTDSLGYSTYIEDFPHPRFGDTLIFEPVYYPPKLDSIFSR